LENPEIKKCYTTGKYWKNAIDSRKVLEKNIVNTKFANVKYNPIRQCFLHSNHLNGEPIFRNHLSSARYPFFGATLLGMTQ